MYKTLDIPAILNHGDGTLNTILLWVLDDKVYSVYLPKKLFKKYSIRFVLLLAVLETEKGGQPSFTLKGFV